MQHFFTLYSIVEKIKVKRKVSLKISDLIFEETYFSFYFTVLM